MEKAERSRMSGLSLDQLLAVRDAADGLIRERLQSEKRDLQARLDRIARYEAATVGEAPKRAKNGQRRAPAKRVQRRTPPKYRDPDSGQTWAGRGLKPRWMRAAIAAGKSPADFLIAGMAH